MPKILLWRSRKETRRSMCLEKGNIVGIRYLGFLVLPNQISKRTDLEDKRSNNVLEIKVCLSSF